MLEKTYLVDEEFIRQAYNEACDGWKSRLREKFPKIFNRPVLKKGEWYIIDRSKSVVGRRDGEVPALVLYQGNEHTYGWNHGGEWSNHYAGFREGNYDPISNTYTLIDTDIMSTMLRFAVGGFQPIKYSE